MRILIDDHFLRNKYQRWYFAIIDKASVLNRQCYLERHHIIPISLGGTNSKENLVKLTAREHFICHRLLIKMTIGLAKKKMVHAIHLMLHMKSKTHGGNRSFLVGSRLYKHLREEYSKTVIGYKHTAESRAKMSISSKASRTPDVLQRISESQRGKTVTAEQRQRISEATRAAMTPEVRQHLSNLAKLRGPTPEATKRKMSQSHRSKIMTPELRAAYSTAGKVWTGRKHSPETINKMSNSHLGIKTLSYKVTCPHCGKTGAARGMNGSHFDRCKHFTTTFPLV